MIPPQMAWRERGFGLGLGRKWREPDLVAAGDFETVNGKVFTFQFCQEGKEPRLIYLHENPKVAREFFYGLFDDLPDRGLGVCGFYFLKFDIQCLFLDKPHWFTGLAALRTDEHHEGDFSFQGVLSWPTPFVIFRKGNKKILVFDIFRFFEGGLATVCSNLRLPIQKMDRPDYIGERYPTNEETEYFEDYAKTDVSSSVGIVREILKIFERYDLGLKISNAHLAASIFLKHFTNGKGLDKPDFLQQIAAMKAYHGGRNSLTVPKVPFVAKDCQYWDVSSNYPYCATKCPPAFGGRWVWNYDRGQEIQENGIYKSDFEIVDVGPYQLLMDHEGSYLEAGQHVEIWLSGIEILTAKKHGILKNQQNIVGFMWEPGKDYTGKHPVKEYMEHFYQEKSASKGKYALYEHAKKMLNTLYGKFISTIPFKTDEKGEVWHIPGSIFNAPMGCLITAWSRCLIFEAEIKYGSLHAATDSILCPGPLFPKNPENPKMGDFTLEYEGDFVVGRNKLYAIIDREITKLGFTGEFEEAGKKKRYFWEGREVLKFALHAFQGNVLDFLEAVFHGKKEYTARRMGNIRESLKNPEITPLAFNNIPMEVNFAGKYSKGLED